jgi:hypothetical protein
VRWLTLADHTNSHRAGTSGHGCTALAAHLPVRAGVDDRVRRGRQFRMAPSMFCIVKAGHAALQHELSFGRFAFHITAKAAQVVDSYDFDLWSYIRHKSSQAADFGLG